MKISVDPMPTLRALAETKINAHFNAIAAQSAQQDAEHQRKREIAKAVLAGDAAPPNEFRIEAGKMGVSILELAKLVSGKPDAVLERGLARRSAILAARSAKTKAELTAILSQSGIQETP